jgi:peptidoglycan/LPS O-acetylase OafA/YrhL
MTFTTQATAPARTGTRLPRLESLTGLRWWAAFAVFLHHSQNYSPLPLPFAKVLPFGVSGVTFFFVLSGFVLTWSHFERDTAGRFYWRRFARIWPLHLVATLLAVPVFYAATAHPGQSWVKPYDWGTIVLSLLLLHAWVPDTKVFFGGNPASWSLSCEMFFYAIFPFLVRPALRRRIRWLAVIFVVVAVGMWVPWLLLRGHVVVGHPDLAMLLTRSPAARAFEFLLGLLVAVAIRRGWRSPIGAWTAMALLAGALTGLVVWQFHSGWWWVAQPLSIMNQATAPFYALLIAAVATRDLKGGGSLLRSRPMVALGQWSYAFYLVHATVLYAAREAWGLQPRGFRSLVPMAGILLVAIALSALLYKLIEHPLERRLRAMLKRPAAEVPATADTPPTDTADPAQVAELEGADRGSARAGSARSEPRPPESGQVGMRDGVRGERGPAHTRDVPSLVGQHGGQDRAQLAAGVTGQRRGHVVGESHPARDDVAAHTEEVRDPG